MKRLTKLLYRRDDPQVGATQQEIIDTTLAEGQWHGEVVNVTAEGRRMVLDSRVRLLRDESGEPVGMLGISTDITARKAMERQLRQQERLAAIGQLASGIAHDFRNLLTTIILYAGLPLRKPDLSPDLAESLATIKEEAEKATDLVQQILDFSSSAMIERRPLEMGSFLDDILAVLRRAIPETVCISLEAGAGPYLVEADAGRLQQALTNLALNARDAMPEGGELRFTLSRVTTGCEGPSVTADVRGGDWARHEPADRTQSERGEWIRLTIEDTGIGMTERVQQHLFEPFFTTKEVGEGTGLGLAQVYGIVRQHQGVIDVETELGRGTTFLIYLPAHGEEALPAEQEQQAAAPGDAPQGLGETILLVEDEENVRRAAKSMLESLGYAVLTAANGREALALCQSPRWSGGESTVDLVITDVVMPEMGGMELLQRLGKTNHSLKGVAMTGYALGDSDMQALREAGFVDVVRKPFELDDLAQPVRRALAAGHAPPPGPEDAGLR